MRSVAIGLAVTLALAACGGGGTSDGGSPAAADCSPGGTEITISAKNLKFSENCLAAPAGQDFTIKFNNQDTDQHNVAIYRTKGGKKLFAGKIFGGSRTETYEVTGLDSGSYYFQCDVHPGDMNGAFVVK